MPKVFISYSRKDIDYAARLHQALEGRGVVVWRDVEDMPPGKPFPEETANAIQQTDMMVLIWSDNSCDSWFVNLEWNTAIAQKRPVLPVFLGKFIPLPAALSPMNGIPGKGVQSDARRIANALLSTPEPMAARSKQRPIRLRRLGVAGLGLSLFAVLMLVLSTHVWGSKPAVGKRFYYCVRREMSPMRVGNLVGEVGHHCTHQLSGQVFGQVEAEKTVPLNGAVVKVMGQPCRRWPGPSHLIKTKYDGKFELQFCPINPKAVDVLVSGPDGMFANAQRRLNLQGYYGKTYVLKRIDL